MAKRIQLANNSRIPNAFSTVANWVQNCATIHRIGAGGALNLSPVFINGLISTNSEQDAYYDFTLRVGLYIFKTKTFTQFTFDGSIDYILSKSWGMKAADPISVDLDPGDLIMITNRRVATDAGAAGTYNVIANTGGQTFRQDGIISGTNPAIDYTMGVGIAWGAKCNPIPKINDDTGAITALFIDQNNLGNGNYSAGLNLQFYYGDDVVGAANGGTDLTGSGAGGFANVSGGFLSSVSISPGGSGYRSKNPPMAFIGGTGSATTGYGTPTQIYGPSAIIGETKYKVPSVCLLGDSYMGYGGIANESGNRYGDVAFYERALATKLIPNFNMSVGGESAAGWNATSTRMKSWLSYLKNNLGISIDNVIIGLSNNDLNSNNNSDVISVTQNNVAVIRDYFATLGAESILVTAAPKVTGTYTTVGGQSPALVGGATTNYAAGGRVDQYNQSIMNGTVASYGVIDIGNYCRAEPRGSNSYAFRTNAFNGVSSNAFTSDGVHYNVTVGLPYLLKNCPMPNFYVS